MATQTTDFKQIATDYLAAVGRRLSERVAAVWPNLTSEQRAEFKAERTEDGMRALLAKAEL